VLGPVAAISLEGSVLGHLVQEKAGGTTMPDLTTYLVLVPQLYLTVMVSSSSATSSHASRVSSS
jgi:hypothetical protein